MLLIYVDESGTSLKDPMTPYFVLAAFMVPVEASDELDRRVAGVKKALVGWAAPEDWEIKGREMRQGRKMFQRVPWESRLHALDRVAMLIAELPARSIAIQVDKKAIEGVALTDADLYRMAFWRLLDELHGFLGTENQRGLLMMDARSDQATAAQDRRVLDSFLLWKAERESMHLVGRPWFGVSTFYAGLQLADFVAYMIDLIHNDCARGERVEPLRGSFSCFERSVRLVRIP